MVNAYSFNGDVRALYSFVSAGNESKRLKTAIIIVLPIVVVVVLVVLIISIFIFLRARKQRIYGVASKNPFQKDKHFNSSIILKIISSTYTLTCSTGLEVDDTADLETLVFGISTIRTATDNFSDANNIGQGGFGAVYKVVRKSSICNGLKCLSFCLSFALLPILNGKSLLTGKACQWTRYSSEKAVSELNARRK